MGNSGSQPNADGNRKSHKSTSSVQGLEPVAKADFNCDSKNPIPREVRRQNSRESPSGSTIGSETSSGSNKTNEHSHRTPSPQTNRTDLPVLNVCQEKGPLSNVYQQRSSDTTLSISHGMNSTESWYIGAEREENHNTSCLKNPPVDEDKPSLSRYPHSSSTGMASASLGHDSARDETPSLWGVVHPDQCQTTKRAETLLENHETATSRLKTSSPVDVSRTDVSSSCNLINSKSIPRTPSDIKQEGANPCLQDGYEESRVCTLNTECPNRTCVEPTQTDKIVSETRSSCVSRVPADDVIGPEALLLDSTNEKIFGVQEWTHPEVDPIEHQASPAFIEGSSGFASPVPINDVTAPCDDIGCKTKKLHQSGSDDELQVRDRSFRADFIVTSSPPENDDPTPSSVRSHPEKYDLTSSSTTWKLSQKNVSGVQEAVQLPPLVHEDPSDETKDSNDSNEVLEPLMFTKVLSESPNSVTCARVFSALGDEKKDLGRSTNEGPRKSGAWDEEMWPQQVSTTSVVIPTLAQDVISGTEEEPVDRFSKGMWNIDSGKQPQVEEDELWSLQVIGASGGEPLFAECASGLCPSDEVSCSRGDFTQHDSSDDMHQARPDSVRDDGHSTTASESDVDSCEDNTLLETRKNRLEKPCPSSSSTGSDPSCNDLSQCTERLSAMPIDFVNITSHSGASSALEATDSCEPDAGESNRNDKGENQESDMSGNSSVPSEKTGSPARNTDIGEQDHHPLVNSNLGGSKQHLVKTTAHDDGKSCKPNNRLRAKPRKANQADDVFAGKSEGRGTKRRLKAAKTPSKNADCGTTACPGSGKCREQGGGKPKKQFKNQNSSSKKKGCPEQFRCTSGTKTLANTVPVDSSTGDDGKDCELTIEKGIGCTTNSRNMDADRVKTKSTTSKVRSNLPLGKASSLDLTWDKLKESVQRRSAEVLTKHKKKIEEIDAILDKKKPKKKGKKPAYQRPEDFEKRKQESHALEQKKRELEDQEQEFQKFQNAFTDALCSGKCLSRKNLEELRNAFERECVRLDNALPIYGRKTVIVDQVRQSQVSIVLGETGSGKSTQMVQYFYEAGFAEKGVIACTQPRKVAASSLCTRVAQEMGNKQLVGCRVGAQSPKNTLAAKIVYTTDHALLNECLKDRSLSRYSCIIIDEAHERSIYTDLLLGMVKTALQTRPELRVVITSATIDPDLFLKYFNGCPVLRVSGRIFPVDVVYSELGKTDYVLGAVGMSHKIHITEEEGDVLVFLTSPAEVEQACEKLQDKYRGEDVECVPLHGKLRQEDQSKVFQSYPGKRKVIFATNCAETSITVPGVKYVVDSGKVKEMKFDAKRNMSSLVVTDISQSSAEQRKGRAGRTQAGKCYRLYSQDEYEAMHKQSAPEILRIHLGQAILKLMELGVENPAEFDFVQSPPKESLQIAKETLKALGAINDGRLTKLGRSMARLPLEPRLARLVFRGIDQNVGSEALILAAVATVNGSIFFRMGSDEEKKLADARKVSFCQEGGDLLTLLAAYREWSAIAWSKRNRWCYENSLNAKALRIAEDTVKELKLLLKHELRVEVKDTPAEQDTSSRDETLRKILLSCYISNLCMFSGHERAGYLAVALGQCVVLHPSSALKVLNFNPSFAVYGQLLETSRKFLLNVTPVEEKWLEESIKESGLDIDLGKLKASVLEPETYTCSGELMNASLLRRGFKTLKRIEEELTQDTHVETPVILEVDKKSARVTSFAPASCKSDVRAQVEKRLENGRQELQREAKELPVLEGCNTTRALVGSGGLVQRLLMPNMHRSVVSKNVPPEIPLLRVLDELKAHGTVVSHKIFDDDRKVIVTYTSPEAVASVLGFKERFPFNVDVYQTDQNNVKLWNCGLKVKLTWCRRPSKGTAQISFKYHEDDIEEVLVSLHSNPPPFIKYGAVKFKQDKFHPARLFLWNLQQDITESDIEKAFASACPDVMVDKVFLHRQKEFETSPKELHDLKTTLESAVSGYVRMGKFQIQVQPPKNAKACTYVAYLHFQDAEYGRKALDYLEMAGLSTQLTGKVTMTPQLQCTMRCPKDIYASIKDSIEEIKTECLNHCQEVCRNSRTLYVDIKQCSGKQVILIVRSECIQHYVHVTGAIRNELDGDVVDCSGDSPLDVLLSPGGRDALRRVQEKTGALIYSDHKSMSIKIYGKMENKEAAKRDINSVLEELFVTDSKMWEIHLRAPNRPRGLLKAVVSRHGVDLLGLQRLKGVQSVTLDLRSQVLRINSSKDGYDAIEKSVGECAEALPMEPSMSVDLPDEIECAVCLGPVEGRVYRLSCCGHAYCLECAQMQVKAAISGKNLPLQCVVCEESFAWKDIQNIVQDKEMRSLVEASIDHYVSTNPEKVKHCLTPDCGAVYVVSVHGKPFMCYGCQVELCTSCHVQYHQGLSCVAYQSEKKDIGVENYLKEHQNTKRCPKCRVLIEKTEGCNHMTCGACHTHMCWRCLEMFPTPSEVYAHQSKCRF